MGIGLNSDNRTRQVTHSEGWAPRWESAIRSCQQQNWESCPRHRKAWLAQGFRTSLIIHYSIFWWRERLKPRLSEKYKFSPEKRTFCQLFLVVQYKNKFNAQNVKLQVPKMTEYFFNVNGSHSYCSLSPDSVVLCSLSLFLFYILPTICLTVMDQTVLVSLTLPFQKTWIQLFSRHLNNLAKNLF